MSDGAPTDYDGALLQLEREVERGTVAAPPSDGTIDRWQSQAERLLASLQESTIPGRNRLVRKSERFLSSLEDLRERKARYIARRNEIHQAARYEPALSVVPLPANFARQQLSASILEALSEAAYASGQMRQDQKDVLPFSPTTEPPPAEPTLIASSAAKRTPDPVANEESPTSVRPAEPPTPPAQEARTSFVPTHPSLSRRTDPIIAVEGRLAKADSFEAAKSIALTWLSRHSFELPPDRATDFELQTKKGHTASAVSLPDLGLWAIQAETADTSLEGRRWRVEMVLLNAQPTPAVSVTLTAISPGGSPQPPTSIPKLVTRLAQEIGLRDTDDGALLTAGPTRISDFASLARALVALRSPKRSRPILVLSTYLKDQQLKTFMDPKGLADKLGGLAQVFVLDREMVWPFNEQVGRKAAVSGATIRFFRPGFTSDDDPGRHPVWSPTELSTQGLSLLGLSGILLQEAAYQSLRALERDDAIPAFDRVREMVLRRQIEEARRKAEIAATQRSDGDELTSLREEIESEIDLRKLFEEDNAKLQEDLEGARTERNALRDERDTLRGRVMFLESRVQELVEQLRESKGAVEPEFPDNWEELEDWCNEHLGDRIVLTRKAVRAAQGSLFEDIAYAYRVLWFLAEEYVPARRNGGESYKQGLSEMGLDISRTGKSAHQHRSKNSYQTDYKNERLTLDWHVSGSSDRDPRFGFRIYFHWHERDRCMVIGSMPEHLDNELS